VIFVHCRAAARGHQHRFGPHKAETACAHVDHQHTCQRRAVARGDQANGAMLLQLLDRAGQNLLHQAVDDLDPCQIALMHCAVRRLARKSLLVQTAIWVAIEEAADFIFQLADAHHRLFA
jgi:hypothetical protein